MLFSSCESENEEVIINDFKGFYKIESISSTEFIDLNNDGLKSNDYLNEIKSIYLSYDGRQIDYKYDNELIQNFAEARPTPIQTNATQFLDIRFPSQRIDSIYQGNNTYTIMNIEYYNLTSSFLYKLTESDIEIESDPFNHFGFYGLGNFDINRLDTMRFEISFNYNIYDFTEKEWIETNLTTRYKKVED
jgi:hypothetical protein